MVVLLDEDDDTDVADDLDFFSGGWEFAARFPVLQQQETCYINILVSGIKNYIIHLYESPWDIVF